MNAIYFVVDERLADIVSAQALHLAKMWDCDVHIFIERRNAEAKTVEVNYDSIYYHYDELIGFLPENLPCTDSWPHIIYLRLFAPQLLANYTRLLYLDADVLGIYPEPDLWSVPLPYGIGASIDYGVIEHTIPPFKDLTRSEWLTKIGVKSNRYFNSGVLLIEVSKWLPFDFSSAIPSYFKYYPHATCFDQDFLNSFLDGKWTDIGPKFNYQVTLLSAGLSKIIAPCFVHFCQSEKPWHGRVDPGQTTLDRRFYQAYRALLCSAHVDPTLYECPAQMKPHKVFKAKIRKAMSRLGIKLFREQLVYSRYKKHRQQVIANIRELSNLSTSRVDGDEFYFDGVNIRSIFAFPPSWEHLPTIEEI